MDDDEKINTCQKIRKIYVQSMIKLDESLPSYDTLTQSLEWLEILEGYMYFIRFAKSEIDNINLFT